MNDKPKLWLVFPKILVDLIRILGVVSNITFSFVNALDCFVTKKILTVEYGLLKYRDNLE